ncbi:MAG: hypothetical protein IJ817_01940 [Clostridia bacterium]|nr:hypothetical protein [Clostridia bacterium]
MEEVNVIIKEDDSVEKLLNKTAKSLQKKYSKKRKINEKLLRKKTPLQKTFSIIGDVLCGILVLFAGIICFSGINSRIQNVCPTFAGYSNLTIQSGSMVASGFNVGDTVIVKTVDAKTLHADDKIAFYVYPSDYNDFDINTCISVEESEIAANAYTTSFGSVFGVQTSSIVKAAKAKSKLVFHHIRAVYEATDGTRWFKTYGSSNGSDDSWYVSENMVVGLYDNSSAANVFSKIISATNSGYGFLILLIPVLFLALILVLESLKDVERAKLELDCVEEKRRITDPICVKNNVGFGMDTKTKYKILAQSTLKNRNEYISLLWKDGTAPANIRKYYSKKNILLSYNRKMLKLNRECEKMFKDGVSATKIARYYSKQKEILENEQVALAKELRSMGA